MKLNTLKRNFLNRNATLKTFSGMFFWWAAIVLYMSNQWEGITVYLVGLFPVLTVCLLICWCADRMFESWRKRSTLGWGLVVLAYVGWIFATRTAAKTRGIEFGSDGPFMVGGIAVWINLVALLVLLIIGTTINKIR